MMVISQFMAVISWISAVIWTGVGARNVTASESDLPIPQFCRLKILYVNSAKRQTKEQISQFVQWSESKKLFSHPLPLPHVMHYGPGDFAKTDDPVLTYR